MVVIGLGNRITNIVMYNYIAKCVGRRLCQERCKN